MQNKMQFQRVRRQCAVHISEKQEDIQSEDGQGRRREKYFAILLFTESVANALLTISCVVLTFVDVCIFSWQGKTQRGARQL